VGDGVATVPDVVSPRTRSITVDSRRAVELDAALDRVDLPAMFAVNGPYWNQGRYLPGAAAASQMPGGATTTVGVPWYRQDWALAGAPLVDGARAVLDDPGLAGAARTVFGGTVVRPHTVYANVQLPAVGTDLGHVDVPEFRGVTRDRFPVVLLHLMNRSGLFRVWQLDICTAVTWLWDGPRGDFVLWLEGPDAAPMRFEPPLTGRAVVADNDRVFHAVGDFARPDGPAPELLTPTTEVHVDGDAFVLRDGDAVLGSWPFAAVRRSVSWKAYVFADAEAAAVFDEHRDDLDERAVLETFASALAADGIGLEHDGIVDDRVIRTLTGHFPKRPPRPW
jgi:hypothetical protein